MKKQIFTREEVLELIIEAFGDGMATNGDDYDREFFVADDYLLKFDKENNK